MENQTKRSYFVNVTEVKDNQTCEVMNFNFGGHHDLAALYEQSKALGLLEDAHEKELVLGVRFLHHALKKYPDNKLFADFLAQLDEFKKALCAQCCK